MRRIKELDAIRGLAAVLIIWIHIRLQHKVPIARTAIDMFFVLSGYLITTIILDQSRGENFLARSTSGDRCGSGRSITWPSG